MFNYAVDPAVLQPHLPPYTELDLFEGKALVSVVGFLFQKTKVMGVKWPFHINFEEVNLRYYVKRMVDGETRRGVGFVSEIVPKRMISTMANALYNEHYSTAEMSHHIVRKEDELQVAFQWKPKGQEWYSMEIKAETVLQDIAPGSEAEFIFEHYFGYNQLDANTTIEYAVAHPRWQVYPVKFAQLHCNVAALYGTAFAPFIQQVPPHSVFLAEGSGVTVKRPVKIKQL